LPAEPPGAAHSGRIEIAAVLALPEAMTVTITAPAAETARPDALGPVSPLRPAPEISVILPTFNARADVPVLVERLGRVLAACEWEVIFVDDNSADGTAAVARAIGAADARVRCLRRIGRRGLASGALEGMLASQARYLAVIDADPLAEDAPLVEMLQRLRGGLVDLVVASRYLDAAVAGAPDDRSHRWASALKRRLLGQDLSDPMSGTFMIRRDAFEPLAPVLSSQSTSLLFDLALVGRGRLRVAELARAGQKPVKPGQLDAGMAIEFCGLTFARLTHDAISIRFLMFCLVGLSGVGIHMGILWLGLLGVGMPFAAAQTVAAIGAMVWNFTLNNTFTYHDRRLTGRAFVSGLIRFQVICAIGAISNIGVASFIYSGGQNWWIAGLGGVVMGAVWNYAVTSVFVWRRG
jgi:dolichol-phosphate mannosyltransferase